MAGRDLSARLNQESLTGKMRFDTFLALHWKLQEKTMGSSGTGVPGDLFLFSGHVGHNVMIGQQVTLLKEE